MEDGIKKLPLGEKYAKKARSFENALFSKWIEDVEADLSSHQVTGAEVVH